MRNFIVIPCYNEANRLKFESFQEFINTNPDDALCFVNDGSKDSTLLQLQGFQVKNKKQVLIYDIPQNGGKAEAVKSGINYILENHQVASIGFLDADLATGFKDYKMLSNTLKTEELKMVIGSRKMEADNNIERSVFRELASAVIETLIKFIIGLQIKDTQCGAKVFDASTARYLFKKSFMSRWLFDVELFIRMKNLYGKQTMTRVKEIAVTDWEEVEGSHITLSDSLKFPKELLEIGYAYNVRPMYVSILKPQTAIIKSLFFRRAS
jgi:glycosyltransferase involved in cell wall biosynthesis